MNIEKYLNQLNANQKKAVQAPRQPILLIAGPGTGKTRTIIARIVYSIEKYQIPPEKILALTFSNKAANELKSRLSAILEERAERIFCGTFHSFCLTVLRKNHELVNLDPFFTVCDDEYQNNLLLQILKRRKIPDAGKKVKGILLAFSNHRLKGKQLPGFSASVFQEYTKHLQQHRLIDFDQVLTLTLELFEKYPDVLEQYRFLYQSILVDEFQDTDRIQYQIVKKLAQKHKNIFVVADDDQSIYSWRGANPENIRDFMNDFRIETPLLLEENYRSGQSIIDTAQLILEETDRIEPEKKIQSVGNKEANLTALFFDQEGQEIDFIINKIKYWRDEQNIDYNEMAILYPFHRIGEQLATYLLKERIPFQMAQGKNLTDHPLMKRLLLYLKLIHDPSDSLILEHLMRLELGEHLTKKILQWATLKGMSLRKALNQFASGELSGPKVKNQLQTFIGQIANLINLKTFFTFDRLIQEILNGMKNLQSSVLKAHYKQLVPLNFKKEAHLTTGKRTIWVYHPDEQIGFLERALLKNVFDTKVEALTEDGVVHVNQNDLVLLSKPCKSEPVSAYDVRLYEFEEDGRRGSLSTLFRWLQVQIQPAGDGVFKDYVVFDLETTGRDPARDGIVEIAAVRVRDGKIEQQFNTLVNPGIAIKAGAQAVHHISQADVQDAPTPQEVLPEFFKFVGKDMLIAHNGYAFDFKFLDRYAKVLGLPRLKNVRYDSLILARNLFPNEQNSIDALAYRYGLDAGTRHRALDDVIVLHKIFHRLLKEVRKREILTSGEDFAEFAALGNVLENKLTEREDRLLFEAGIHKLLSPYSRIYKPFVNTFPEQKEVLDKKLEKISLGQNVQIKYYDSDQEFYSRVLRMANNYRKLPIDEAISEFLAFVALINTQDNLEPVDAVSLLTLYAAKGLEFEKVIISGLEDENIPSIFTYRQDDQDDRPIDKKMDEQKRLLYVGITRSKSEVIFTLVRNRFGRRRKSSPFLDSIKSKIDIQLYSV
ncbi:hypothetical protein DRI50_00205 [candidate division KSB1 bacterium]|nr:MAG: hypothetical protein DRI50_00205 [candidate division KSB1 bacterium]